MYTVIPITPNSTMLSFEHLHQVFEFFYTLEYYATECQQFYNADSKMTEYWFNFGSVQESYFVRILDKYYL